MTVEPHVAIAIATSLGAGWLMMAVGVQKSALESRKRRRICPSCGRQIQTRVCSTCAS